VAARPLVPRLNYQPLTTLDTPPTARDVSDASARLFFLQISSVIQMSEGRKSRTKRAKQETSNDCIVPPAVPKGDPHKLMFRYSEEEARSIRDYVEWLAVKRRYSMPRKSRVSVLWAETTTYGTSTQTRTVGGS
jgi:hypothetical protein